MDAVTKAVQRGKRGREINIDSNKQALATMCNAMSSFENRFRSIYNYGYKDGYEQGPNGAIIIGRSRELVGTILVVSGFL